MKLHVVCGPPACGKTTYGRSLAVREGAAFFDSDTAAEPVVRAGLRAAGLSPDDRDSPRYKEIFREPVYEALYRLAEENLGHLPVVIGRCACGMFQLLVNMNYKTHHLCFLHSYIQFQYLLYFVYGKV